MSSTPARSAIVLATLSVEWQARDENPVFTAISVSLASASPPKRQNASIAPTPIRPLSLLDDEANLAR